MPSRAFALLCLVTAAASARAELPPGSYDKLRSAADSAVVIQVTAVTAAVEGEDRQVTVEAKVLAVERSKTGLKKGDAITIKYVVDGTPKLGPRPVPVLEKDGVYPAFLNGKNGELVPAAMGESFHMTPE